MKNLSINAVNRSFGALLSFIGSFLLGGPACAEDLSNPLSRYLREYVEDESLAHWNTPVFVQFVGRDVDETSFHAASLVSYFGRNSGVEMQFLGDSPSWFLPKTQIEPNANFVFIFEDLDRLLGGNRETITLADLGLDIQSKNSPLAKLVSKGIPSLGPGCFGDWMVKRGNEIVANVHIVDTSMPDEVQRECVKYGASSSFGVYYTVNTLTFTGASGRDTPAVFLDESELVFLLRAASFCRNELGDSSIECPKKVLSHVYKFHSELITK